MCIVTLLFLIFAIPFPNSRSDQDGCLTNEQTDPGVSIIRDIRAAIDEEVCELVTDTLYSDYDPEDNETYDFIVVGGGSAGAVVANRLSENPNWRVLLLEAGGDPFITEEIPFLPDARTNTRVSWPYTTEQDPNCCLGMRQERCPLPRGKVIGGTSGIASMFYVRGHPGDFDNWERMGNPGWGYDSMLNYFKKSEDFRLWNDPVFHGKGGYLKIEDYKDDFDILKSLLSIGFEELGYQSFRDINGGNHEGFFNIQVAFEDGKRCSSAKAFLHGFQSRPNLKVSKNSLVKRILIDQAKTTYGVEFTKSEKTFKSLTSKEVILSAGSINSPQLLMLSGIGPYEHLTSLGIEGISDLKVGFNFQDHTAMRAFAVSLERLNISNSSANNVLSSMFEFLLYKKGDFAKVSPALNVNGFINTSNSTYPDMQFIFGFQPANSSEFLQEYLVGTGFNEMIVQSLITSNVKHHTLFTWPSLLRPKSKGKVLLKSKNPTESPLIYPGYFSEVDDILQIIQGIRFIERLIDSLPFRNVKASIQRVDVPKCNTLEFQSDPYWECMIRYLSASLHHPVGTCRMGPRDHEDSVVDSALQVIGIKHLRVVDASIMPDITSGNTLAPTLAIAKKGSDLIKMFWKT